MIIYKYTRFDNVNNKFIENNSCFFKDFNKAKLCAEEFIKDLKDEDNLQYKEELLISSDELYRCVISYDGYYNSKINILITIKKIYVYD